MAHKFKNSFHLDISEKYYYKKDNILVTILKFYFDHLKRHNEVSYLIRHHETGIEFNVPERQLSRSKEQKFKKSPFRELDYVYHLHSKQKTQPKCYEIISIIEEEGGHLNHHCRELYTQNFEDFSQNQLSYCAHVLTRMSEDNLWR